MTVRYVLCKVDMNLCLWLVDSGMYRWRKSTHPLLGSFSPDCPLPYWRISLYHCFMADSISCRIETLSKGVMKETAERGILFFLWYQVIGVVLGGPLHCSLHRFLHNRSEILDVLQDTEGLVLKMRHSKQDFHLGRQQSG